nr:hypothetical protein [Actinomadura sp. CNU-125]
MTTDDIATTGEITRLARAALSPSFPGATAPGWLLDELERGLGGVTLFALTGNVPSPESLAALTARMRGAGAPLVSIDEEGGDVTRLGGHATGSPYPGNAALGAVDDPELTAGSSGRWAPSWPRSASTSTSRRRWTSTPPTTTR